MIFKIEFWFRYAGANEKDFEIENVEAEDYEEACEKITTGKKRRVFDFKNLNDE